MKILVTGARGFIGKNLISTLQSQADKKHIIYSYEFDTPKEMLMEYTKDCDFVYHFAAVHRPVNKEEFREINYMVLRELIKNLRKNKNTCPILYTSSIQAVQDTDYAKSKKDAENELINYEKKTGAKAIIYRLTNTFGKWAKVNAHSVVANYCYNIARGYEIYIRDPNYLMDFYYIDDVIDSFIKHLDGIGKPNSDGFYSLDQSLRYSITLSELAERIMSFCKYRDDLSTPLVSDAFTKKLYSTYVSYLPSNEMSYSLKMNEDVRGSFTEIFKREDWGQLSVNIIKPGISKGEHWHRTKCEKFLVISGKGIIRMRKVLEKETISFIVSSNRMEIIEIPAGYTHNIHNIGQEDLVILIWANEIYNNQYPDTYPLKVEISDTII